MQWILKSSLFLVLTACGDSFLLNNDDSGAKAPAKPTEVATYQNLGLTANLHWRVGPIIDDPNTLLVIVTDSNQLIATQVKNLQAAIRMPEMTHGAYPITIKELQPGIYELSEIIFFMPGLWHLKISLTTDQGSEEVIWPYNF
jgi:hypothetical protein